MYDVALSFASEQSLYVDLVSRSLRDYGVSVFHDRLEQARLWGHDGIEEFSSIYGSREQSFRVLLFISKEYVSKSWPTVERKAALSRILDDPSDHSLLPVRFDDTPVPGLTKQTIYQDARTTNPFDLADLVVDHLVLSGQLEPSVKERRGAAITQARLVGFSSATARIDDRGSDDWRINYKIVNRSDSVIDLVVVTVPRSFRGAWRSMADNQYETAISMVMGPIPAGDSVVDSIDVKLEGGIPFGLQPYAATLLWTDREGNHWSVGGSDLHRRGMAARTC